MKSASTDLHACDAQHYNTETGGDQRGLFAIIAGLAASVVLFFGGLAPMTNAWQTEEYSHAYLIPFISFYLFTQVLARLGNQQRSSSAWGVVCVLASIFLLVLGELSTIATIIQYGFVLCVTGILITLMGLNAARQCWVAIVYLLFMIPLPTIVQNGLSQELQLISSQLGVFLVRIFGVSVYLEGNMIDLGELKLQVVDACSGLRYLFPLMSFGFLVAVLLRVPVWLKILLFVITIPITIFMNSVRIAIVGVTADHFGVAAAEGFLHYFEGWLIFLVCLLLLFLTAQICLKFIGERASLFSLLNVQVPDTATLGRNLRAAIRIGGSYKTAMLLIVACIPVVLYYGHRTESPPPRDSFNTMPLVMGDWMGREATLERDVLTNLQLTDYFLADYFKDRTVPPVNLYVAYYASQKKGAGIHSPRSCMPAGGWKIQELGKHRVQGAPVSSTTGDFVVNRAIIQKGDDRSVIYYWFDQRGRILTNELLIRWYIFIDSITQSRSDGSLVRVSVPWVEHMDIQQIDDIAHSFIGDVYPMLDLYLPD